MQGGNPVRKSLHEQLHVLGTSSWRDEASDDSDSGWMEHTAQL